MAGIAAGVPDTVISNLTLSAEKGEISKEYTPEAFVELTGVEERRISDELCASDLGFKAAEKLIADLSWNKDEIGALIFVSQTPDYILPATACILQNRLGLSTECYAVDMSLGCSGWVYGLSEAVSLLSGGEIQKALLVVGDAKKRVDLGLKIKDPLFGGACTVTALEYKEGASGFRFHFGTDGSGYDAIITPDGGARNPIKPETSFKLEELDGRRYHRMMSRMKGMDVFSFGITTAPKSVKKLAEHYGFDYQTYDWFLFHQANMKMNNMIVKKLKLPAEKVPYSMRHFGNTNGASIPLTLVTQLKGKVEDKPTKFICCGFGVGLSWGTVAFETDGLVLSDLVEVNDSVADGNWA